MCKECVQNKGCSVTGELLHDLKEGDLEEGDLIGAILQKQGGAKEEQVAKWFSGLLSSAIIAVCALVVAIFVVVRARTRSTQAVLQVDTLMPSNEVSQI
jgi:hypothetical protein